MLTGVVFRGDTGQDGVGPAHRDIVEPVAQAAGGGGGGVFRHRTPDGQG